MGWRDWANSRLVVPVSRPDEGWRLAGNDVYTCVPPPGYEKDPAITAAIREFDPEMIPGWRIQLWHPPNEESVVRVVRHQIFRHYPYPKRLRARFHVELPADWEGPEPNFLDAVFEDPKANNFIGPPAYLAWDWRAYRWCRTQFVLLTVEKYRQRVEAHRARIIEARRKHQEDLEYIRRDVERRVAPVLETITPEDWNEYEQLRQRGRPRRPTIVVPGGGSPPST